MKKVFPVLLIVVLSTGCSTAAHIEKSWRDPDALVDMAKPNKVLVMALLKNEIKQKLKGEGSDGVVVISLANVDKK